MAVFTGGRNNFATRAARARKEAYPIETGSSLTTNRGRCHDACWRNNAQHHSVVAPPWRRNAAEPCPPHRRWTVTEPVSPPTGPSRARPAGDHRRIGPDDTARGAAGKMLAPSRERCWAANPAGRRGEGRVGGSAPRRTSASSMTDTAGHHAIAPENWRAHAACKDHDVAIFFPPPSNGRPSLGPFERALAVCRTCAVTEQCLQESYAMESYDGVWGGETPTQRRNRARGLATPRGPIRHGTMAGYRAHELGGTPPCSMCVAAHARAEHAEERKGA